ncbi:MAG: fatty acid--CoA ligase [Thiothrix sp.]|nr:fatty acid--CoA ligase [Thiothrix sp.]
MNHTVTAATTAYAYPLLIKQLLPTALLTAPQQEIVYADKSRHTYTDLNRRIHQLGHGLTRLGVKPGSTVAVMDWDTPRYLECFFAIPMLGAVLQTVNVRLAPEQIAYTLNHARAEVLLINHEFLPLLEQIRSELADIHTFILLSDEDEALPTGFASEYEALLAGQPEQFDFPDFDENTRATTFYTTGTTGLPKGVFFSHRQLVLHTLGTAATLGMAPEQGRFHRGDVYMPLTPMFHVHAWGIPLVATMAGIKQVYPGRYEPGRILQLCRDEAVTFSHCVPAILQMLLTHPACAGTDLSHWKVIIGGSALTRALAQMALDKGIDVMTGYGMSETCPLLTLAQLDPSLDPAADPHLAVRVRTGRPLPLVDLRIVDPDMTPLPNDGTTTGEVVVRSPWLTQGYLFNPEASETLWEGGWLHTQDVGRIDPQGYLQVTDRIKDVVKTGGEWISSVMLEDMISQYPAVAESAVIAIPDEKWGERPLALIVLKAGADASAADIRTHLGSFVDQGVLSKFGIPDADHIRFVDTLARTSVGKLNKRRMREDWSRPEA